MSGYFKSPSFLTNQAITIFSSLISGYFQVFQNYYTWRLYMDFWAGQGLLWWGKGRATKDNVFKI